ncbi:MAG: polysaccharide biosynthesis/export family protein [Polyangiaceae bacterium]|nr:polysaccharide biosynthesis/export family protein [Polyangiaceae bacterium]
MSRSCWVWLLLVGVMGCQSAASFPHSREPDPRQAEYVIAVPDQLRVRVWANQELNAELQVRPDGLITLPLIGDVRAAGMTPTQLKNEITKRLSAFIKADATTVTIEVAQIRSYRIVVSGNVNRPGVVDESRFLTVGEAIALAGGPSRFASPEDTEVIRTRANGSVVRIPVRYDLIMKGHALEQDLVLLRGDLIYVP